MGFPASDMPDTEDTTMVVHGDEEAAAQSRDAKLREIRQRFAKKVLWRFIRMVIDRIGIYRITCNVIWHLNRSNARDLP